MRYITPYVKDVKHIFEIGSMDGRDGRILKNHFPGAELYMFEGLKENYEGFLQTDEPDVHTFNVVLSDFDGDAKFWVNEENGIHSLYPHRNGLVKPRDVEVYRFDSFSKSKKLPVPDVLKLDVEGAAFNVLRGFGSILKDVQAIHVETETYPYFQGQVLETKVWRLLEQTHKLIQFTRNTVDDLGTQCDSIWVKKS